MSYLDRIETAVATRTADRARKNVTLGGGQGFTQPAFWADPFGAPLWSGMSGERETLANDFESYANQLLKMDSVVAACIFARMMVFSEARFAFQRMRDGRPGDLFTTAELTLLETPWPGGTLGELLDRMEQDTSLGGNFYATTVNDAGTIGAASAGGRGRRIVRMRPDWVTIVAGSTRPNASVYDLDARVLFYVYRPPTGSLVNGPLGDPDSGVWLMPSEVCHYSPIPDPVARFRGMSWLTPVIQEVLADQAATAHKRAFFQNNATLQTVVSLDASVKPEDFTTFVRKFNASHRGARNAYRTLFVGGGADVSVVGANLKELDFKATQGAGETRIAAAAGVPPVWAGLSEGLQGSSLNAGNFGQARRRLADGTVRPLWRKASGSIDGKLVTSPGDARLWFDDRDVAFLREDVKDQADILNRDMLTVESGIRGGFDPMAIVAAVTSRDLRLLRHTGLFSVQLQPPLPDQAAAPADAPAAPAEDGAEPSSNGRAPAAT